MEPTPAPASADRPAGHRAAPPSALCRVDVAGLRRHLDAAPEAWLAGEVARRMADRLSLLREPPRRILDWGQPLGQGEAAH